MTNLFKNSTDPNSLGNQFRRKRFSFFLKNAQILLNLKKINSQDKFLSILDVGGLEEYWENMGISNNPNFQITLLNLSKSITVSSNIKSVVGDATNLSEFNNDSFDLVFSNSVIEHLYNFENQKKMSSEAMRVGKFYFIQTPNKHFFIEPHYLLPFFQYLPRRFQLFILTSTRLSRGRRWPHCDAIQYQNEIRLISYKEIKLLFPHSNIYKELFFGLTKSFTAHNFKF